MWKKYQEKKRSKRERQNLLNKVHHDLWLERKWACHKIGQLQDPILLPELFTLLNDSHQEVQKTAVDAIITFPKENFTEHQILQLIFHFIEPDSAIQASIIQNLIQIAPNRFSKKNIREIYQSLTLAERETLYSQYIKVIWSSPNDRGINALLTLCDLGFPQASTDILKFALFVSKTVHGLHRKSLENQGQVFPIGYFQQLTTTIGHGLANLDFDLTPLFRMLEETKNVPFRQILLQIFQHKPLELMEISPLIACLEEKSNLIRMPSIIILGNLGKQEAILPLILGITPHSSEEIQLILRALEKIDPGRFHGIPSSRWQMIYMRLHLEEKERIYPPLIQNLASSRTESRVHSEQVLQLFPVPEFSQNIIKILEQPDAGAKSAAIRILEGWKVREAIVPLLKQLVDSDFTFENYIISALLKIDPERFRIERRAATLKNIFKRLNLSEIEAIQSHIFNKFPKIGSFIADIQHLRQSSIDLFQKGMESGKNNPANIPWHNFPDKALSILAYMHTQWSEIFLIYLNSHPKEHLRRIAVIEFGRITNPIKAIPILTTLLRHPLFKSQGIFFQLIRTLGQLKSRKTIDPLIQCFDQSNRQINPEIAQALLNFREEWVLEQISSHTKDSSEDIRQGIAYTIGAHKLLKANSSLVELTTDSVPTVKKMAIFSLGQLQTQQSLDRLIEIYGKRPAKGIDGNIQHEFRQSALIAISKYPQKMCTKVLENAISDPNENIKQIAAVILGKLGNPQALPTLKSIISGPDSPLIATAIQALQKIGNSEAFTFLLETLWPAKPEMRQSLIFELNTILAQQPAMAFPILHKTFRAKKLPIPGFFDLFKVLSSLTGSEFDQFESMEIADLIELWYFKDDQLALRLLEAYGTGCIPYIDRFLENEPVIARREKLDGIHDVRDLGPLKELQNRLAEKTRFKAQGSNFSFLL